MVKRFGIPYFRAVQGPDGRYWWARCPVCDAVVRNRDGYGPARHWLKAKHEEVTTAERRSAATEEFARRVFRLWHEIRGLTVCEYGRCQHEQDGGSSR